MIHFPHFCGGSWFISPRVSHVATRYRNTPDYRIDDLGIRLVRKQ